MGADSRLLFYVLVLAITNYNDDGESAKLGMAAMAGIACVLFRLLWHLWRSRELEEVDRASYPLPLLAPSCFGSILNNGR